MAGFVFEPLGSYWGDKGHKLDGVGVQLVEGLGGTAGRCVLDRVDDRFAVRNAVSEYVKEHEPLFYRLATVFMAGAWRSEGIVEGGHPETLFVACTG